MTARPPILARARSWLQARWLAAIATLGLVISLTLAHAWIADLHARSDEDALRAQVSAVASLYANSLGNAINQRLALVRGVAAFVSVEIRNDEAVGEFAAYAEEVRASVGGVRNVSVAPGFVVRQVHPLKGNERVLGNDLLADRRPDFVETVHRAIALRDVTAHGPLPLIQGGMGVIARQAVFRDGAPWGAVGVVFDLDPILVDANLPNLPSELIYGLRRADQATVAGDPAAFVLDPILERIRISDGFWELAVVPAVGWREASRDPQGEALILALIVGFGLLVQMVIVLLAERRVALAALVDARTRDLARRTEELAVAKDELEQFAYAAAHDLQEPVRTLASYTQLLARHLGDGLDAEGRELAAFVTGGAKRLQALLRDVQLFVAEDRAPLPTGPAPADRALAAALRALDDRVREAAATVIRSELPEVMADERRLKEILVVLIGNAIAYRAPERSLEIRIDARREGDADILCVTDNGIGIAPQHHDQIFQVFRRLHRRSELSGTGMGLAIARKMALRLGGGISVDSSPEWGSTFSLRLPSASSGAAA